jgi:hypothetical protein
VVFAFGITPKRTLHNLVANHKDGKLNPSSHNGRTSDISRAAFNCQCDTLISESPFVSEPGTLCSLPETVYSFYLDKELGKHHPSELFCFDLRGPPAC